MSKQHSNRMAILRLLEYISENFVQTKVKTINELRLLLHRS
jgi:hypothetical protein